MRNPYYEICATCGKTLPLQSSGRPRRYCSTRCKSSAIRRKAKIARHASAPPAPTREAAEPQTGAPLPVLILAASALSDALASEARAYSRGDRLQLLCELAAAHCKKASDLFLDG